MFGSNKEILKKMLVDSWNLLAKERGEHLNYISIKGGFEWIVVIHNKLDDDAQSILVALCGSAGEGKRFLAYAQQHPDMLRLWRVRKSLGPYGRLIDENLGSTTYDQWMEYLYKT